MVQYPTVTGPRTQIVILTVTETQLNVLSHLPYHQIPYLQYTQQSGYQIPPQVGNGQGNGQNGSLTALLASVLTTLLPHTTTEIPQLPPLEVV